MENLNPRLRTYFTLPRQLGGWYLGLQQLSLNHRRVMRSRVGRTYKSPRELLPGQEQPHWFTLLGLGDLSRCAPERMQAHSACIDRTAFRSEIALLASGRLALAGFTQKECFLNYAQGHGSECTASVQDCQVFCVFHRHRHCFL